MPGFNIVSRIDAKQVRSLVWSDGDLVDWVGGSDRLLIATSDESINGGEPAENEICSNSICLWDIRNAKIVSQAKLSESAGTLMPINDEYALGFYRHPKIISLRTGGIIHRMEELKTGLQTSSIIHHIAQIPIMAVDAQFKRFAIASDSKIVVVNAET